MYTYTYIYIWMYTYTYIHTHVVVPTIRTRVVCSLSFLGGWQIVSSPFSGDAIYVG